MQVKINTFPWGKPLNAPESFGEILCDKDQFEIRMCSYEKDIRATVKEDNGNVYEDSCLEFFFSPCPEENNSYFNFEINPLGTLYVGFSPTGKKEDSKPVDYSFYKQKINPNAFVDYDKGYWEVSFIVPHDFIRVYCPSFFKKKQHFIKGNFYKCGDKTNCPHFAVWADINIEKIDKPNFHVVEFFKKIEFF